LLWVGWFGFNAGSAVSSSVKTAQALTATQVAAASGALAWLLIEGIRHKKATSLGMASGILAGLVVITPAAGVATVKGAIILGFLASAVCYLAIAVKNKLGYDDSLDVFGIHGIAGIAGALLLSFFVRIGDMPLTTSGGGASGVARTSIQQLAVQAEGVAITILGSALLTLLLLVAIEKTIGLRLHSTDEMAGMDHALHGEHGYGLLNLN
ncbi:MAG: ammonia channel protein, partial [Phycisphaeraceae bacterium]